MERTFEFWLASIFIWAFIAGSILVDRKLRQAGSQVRWFKSGSVYLRERRAFVRLAGEKGWSMLPFYLELVGAIVVLAAIAVFVARHWR